MRSGLGAVLGGVVLGGFPGVVLGLNVVAMRQVRVVAGLLRIPRLVVFRSGAMLFGGVLVMFRSLNVMLSTLFRHGVSSLSRSQLFIPQSSIIALDYRRITDALQR
jgi:hypothetical protein